MQGELSTHDPKSFPAPEAVIQQSWCNHIFKGGGVLISGLWGVWCGPSHSGNVSCGQMSQYSWSSLKRNGHRVLQTKEKKDHPVCCHQALWWDGVVSAALKLMLKLHMVPLRPRPVHITKTVHCTPEDVFERHWKNGTDNNWNCSSPGVLDARTLWETRATFQSANSFGLLLSGRK